jgi:transposase
MAHGLNANLVHKWRRQSRGTSTALTPAIPEFLALALAPAPEPSSAADIRIELHRGATVVNVVWPVAAAAECGLWMRELLR